MVIGSLYNFANNSVRLHDSRSWGFKKTSPDLDNMVRDSNTDLSAVSVQLL